MGTFHKYGYLYPLGLASKLAKTGREMTVALMADGKITTAEEREAFERDYWHAMRKFACGPSDCDAGMVI